MTDRFGTIPIEPPHSRPAPPSRPGPGVENAGGAGDKDGSGVGGEAATTGPTPTSPPRLGAQRPREPQPGRRPPRNPVGERPTGNSVRDRRKPTPATPGRRKPAATPSGQGKLLLLFLVALLLAGYAALGFFGVPYYFKTILPGSYAAMTGLHLETGEVTFNPFNFHLSLKRLRIHDTDGSEIVGLAALNVDLAPLSLLRNSLVSNSLRIDGLSAEVVRNADGAYNIARLIGQSPGAGPSEIIDFSDLPIVFSLNNIQISNSSLRFTDIPADKRHLLEDIQLELPTFSNFPFQANSYLRPHFSATVNGSPVELTGQAHLGEGGDQATRLSLDLHDFDLATYVGYLPFKPPASFEKGRGDGTIALSFDPTAAKGDQLSFAFDLELKGLDLAGSQQNFSLTAPGAQVNGTFRPVSRTIHLHNLTLREPLLRTFGPSLLATWNRLRNDHLADGSIPFALTVDALLVDNGTVEQLAAAGGGTGAEKPLATWQGVQLSVKEYSTDPTGRAEEFGAFRCTAERGGSATLFTWQGNFTGSQQLAGPLTVIKAESGRLLQVAGAAKDFATRGSVDIKGQLHLRPLAGQEGGPPGELAFQLREAEVVVQDFALLDGKKSLLATPLLRLAPLFWDESGIDFGLAQLQGATARFDYRLPPSLRHLTTGRYRLQGLEFDGRATLATGSADEREIDLTSLSLRAGGLVAAEKGKMGSVELTAALDSGGRLSGKGDISLAPFSLTLQSEFTDLPLATLRWLSGTSSFAGVVGKLSGKGQLSLPGKSFSGELQVAQLSRTGAKSGLLGWESARFEEFNYTATPFHLGIARLLINEAELVVLRQEGQADLLQQLASLFTDLLPKAAAKGGTTGKGGASDRGRAISPLDIQSLALDAGRILLRDQRLSPPWQAELSDFSGELSAIHATAAAKASPFAFSGNLDGSEISLEGEIELFAAAANGNCRLMIDSLPLASFHEQLTPRLDINSGIGEVRLELLARRQDGQRQLNGFVELTNLEPLSPDAASALPLALLTGANDGFRLPFDFRPAPGEESVFIDEMIRQFQGLVLKATVSPLLLASGDFSDLVDREFAEFRPGEFMLSDRGREVTSRFSALLIAHPRVGLQLSGGVDPAVDGQALAEQLLEVELARVQRENERLYKQWQERRTAYYEQRRQQQEAAARSGATGATGSIVESDIPTNLLEEFVPIQPATVAVSQEMLLDLARKRLEVLHQYFTTQLSLPPGQITIVEPTVPAGAAAGVTAGTAPAAADAAAGAAGTGAAGAGTGAGNGVQIKLTTMGG